LQMPDLVLIGESDTKAGDALVKIQDKTCTNAPPMERMSFRSAELAKISVNSYVTMKMSFANTLAEICEKLPGTNVDVVTTAIGKDRRIGSAYLRGALGYGGPCFPRDNIAFARLAKGVGAQANLALATHKVNLLQAKRIARLVMKQKLIKGTKIAILGLSYKPHTNIVEESQSLMLAELLAEQGLEVHVFDPAALESAKSVLGDSVKYYTTARECILTSSVCVLATPWEEFRELDPSLFAGRILIDCWRALEDKAAKAGRYVPIGVGSS